MNSIREAGSRVERSASGEATKVISKLVNTAPLAQALICIYFYFSSPMLGSQAELLGLEGAVNVQGEALKAETRTV